MIAIKMENESLQIELDTVLSSGKYELSDLVHVSFDIENKRIQLHFKKEVKFVPLNKEGANFCRIITPYLIEKYKSDFANAEKLIN